MDLDGLNKLRKKHQNNTIISYLNINRFRNKINDLRKICRKTQIHVLCIDETRLDELFPDAQLHIKCYQYPAFRKDCHKNGGGKIVYIKEGLIAKRDENVNIETIFIEITISKRKWCLTFAYRPPYNNNKATSFMELNKSSCNIARKYENILIIGDLNINFDNLKMWNLCDTFLLSNHANGATCVKSQNGTSIDMMLANRPRSFHNTSLVETGLSGCHKMLASVFMAFFTRLPAKVTEYRNHKTFDQTEFLRNLDQELSKSNSYNGEQQYDIFTSIFRRVLHKYAPLKMKKLRRNQAKFMTKELRKAIMDRSRLKNKYLKWPSRENILAYKKGKNIYNSLNNKVKKDFFKKIISIDINGNIVEDEQKLTKEFNSHYTNIAKTTSGKPPMKLENNLDYINDSLITKRVIEKYENHPSIKNIQGTFPVKKEFKIEEAMVEQINKTLRNINSRNATGPDKIPPKIDKMLANIIDSHLTNINNSNLKRNAFQTQQK